MFGRRQQEKDGFTLHLYSVMDIKAEVYFPPFTSENDGSASRQFADLVADPQTKLHKHPEDFRLYRVGSFHADTGVVVPDSAGVVMVTDALTISQMFNAQAGGN